MALVEYTVCAQEYVFVLLLRTLVIRDDLMMFRKIVLFKQICQQNFPVTVNYLALQKPIFSPKFTLNKH